MNTINYYLNNILTSTLIKHGVSQDFIDYTIEIVAMQMNSLLTHWNDRKFRNTVLLLGKEEGIFYDPVAKNDVKCFIVVTLRNSPIEVIQSKSCAKAGLKAPLPDDAIKKITSEAIRYFNQQDFNELHKQALHISVRDLYQELKENFPVAWTALQTLALNQAKTIDYPKVNANVPYELIELVGKSFDITDTVTPKKTYFDGYDPSLDYDLKVNLYYLSKSEQSGFSTDCFKTLTRNVEKLFRVIEFLLTHGYSYTTCNFYLENGHVEKRITPLRASHNGEIFSNLTQLSGLGYKHKRSLSIFINSIAENKD